MSDLDHKISPELSLEDEQVNPTAPGMESPVSRPPMGASTEPPDVGEPGGGKAEQRTAPVKIEKPQKPPKTKEQLEYEAAKKAHFKEKYWKPFLWPITTLLLISMITSLLLGLTNAATAPVIKANTLAVADQTRKELLPQADVFDEVAVPKELSNVTSIHKAANGSGWVIGAWGRGYGGQVPVLVAFDPEGTIVGVTFTQNTETVGLGQKVRDPAFGDQFKNRPAENLTLGDIDKIASATISTNAAVNAVNAAIEAFQVMNGGSIAEPAKEAS